MKSWLTPLLLLLHLSCASKASALPENALTPPPGNRPVVVQVAFYLQDINEIDDENETFGFNGVITLRWQDARQAFDPKEAGLTEKIYQGGYQFDEVSPAWYPQVVLKNESGEYEKRATLLRILPNGTCVLTESVSAIAEGSFNLRRYPFDRQRLDAVFEIFGFDDNEVILKADESPGALREDDIGLSQWTLTGIRNSTGSDKAPYAGAKGASSLFVVTLDVERQSLFMMRLVVLPLIAIVILSWAVFWMDRSSLGDRISVSFVGILTGVAYQIVVSDILPHISYVTFINGVLSISFLLMSATVGVNLVVGAYDQKGRSEVGNLIDRRCRWLFPLVYAGLLALTWFVMFVVL